jgi:hypothetical protein
LKQLKKLKSEKMIAAESASPDLQKYSGRWAPSVSGEKPDLTTEAVQFPFDIRNGLS